MPLTGKVYATGFAAQADCPSLPYQVTAPVSSPETMKVLARALVDWSAEVQHFTALARSGQLTRDVVERAEFGVDVLRTAQMNIQLGVCCTLVAVTPDDDVLGVILYTIIPPDRASINLLAVHPHNMPGSPFVVQLRGVGTSLVAVAAKRLLDVHVETIYLHPLDMQAQRFWQGRGFQPCGLGGLMCIQGREAITALIDGCLSAPEVPLTGDYLLCGLPRPVRERLLR